MEKLGYIDLIIGIFALVSMGVGGWMINTGLHMHGSSTLRIIGGFATLGFGGWLVSVSLGGRATNR